MKAFSSLLTATAALVFGGTLWAQNSPLAPGGALGSGAANLGSLLGNLSSPSAGGTAPFSQGLGQVVSGWAQQGIHGQDLSQRIHWLQEMRSDEMAERMRRFDQNDRWRDIREDRREIRNDEQRLARDRQDLQRDLREPDSRARDRDIREDRREIRNDEQRLAHDRQDLQHDLHNRDHDDRGMRDHDPRQDRDDRRHDHDAFAQRGQNNQGWSNHQNERSDFGSRVGSLADKKDHHPALDNVKKNAPSLGENRPNFSLPLGKGKGKGKG